MKLASLIPQPLEEVPFIVSLSMAALVGRPEGCRISMRLSCRFRGHDKADTVY